LLLLRGSQKEVMLAMANAQLSLGAVLVQQNKPDEALEFLKSAFSSLESLQDFSGIAQASHNMDAAFMDQGNIKESNAQLVYADKYLSQAPDIENISTKASGMNISSEISATSRNLVEETPKFIFSGSSGREKIGRPGYIDPEKLKKFKDHGAKAVTYRLAGKGAGSINQKRKTKAEASERSFAKQLIAYIGDQDIKIQWIFDDSNDNASIFENF
jgi:hypothetical protein